LELGEPVSILDRDAIPRTGRLEYGLDRVLCIHEDGNYIPILDVELPEAEYE
jgi:hypothetical protein